MQTETGKHDDQILCKRKAPTPPPSHPPKERKGKERKNKRPTENNEERGLMTTVDQSEYETTEKKAIKSCHVAGTSTVQNFCSVHRD
jgi:hypothetical protein